MCHKKLEFPLCLGVRNNMEAVWIIYIFLFVKVFISHFAGVVNGIACYTLVDQRLVFDRECSNRSGDAFFSSCTFFF